MAQWNESQPGVLQLPSGRRVRGRGLARGAVVGAPAVVEAEPEFGLYLQGKPPPPTSWPARWVRWPDWWLPADRGDAHAALHELWQRAEFERVEVACTGGVGRTGTALACLAILDGVAPADAVHYVREHYNSRAIETPWQRRYVRRFEP